MFGAFLQNSLHVFAETADLHQPHYFSMLFLVLLLLAFCWNIIDPVCSLQFPIRKLKISTRSVSGAVVPLLCFCFFSSFLPLCFSAALLSFCVAFTADTLIANGLCSTLKASRPLSSRHDSITTGFVRIVALVCFFRRGRGLLVVSSSFLLLS